MYNIRVLRGIPFIATLLLLAQIEGGQAVSGRTEGRVVQSPLGLEEDRKVNVGEFELLKKVRFLIAGRLLSTASYSDTPQSGVSPGDMVVSWGEPLPPGISVTQRKRWYFFSKKPTLPSSAFSTTANFHLVGSLADAALRLPLGTKIVATGWLVDVAGSNGFFWKTSLSRFDRGEGACEIFLIENLKYTGGDNER